jgi:phage terminase large subunit
MTSSLHSYSETTQAQAHAVIAARKLGQTAKRAGMPFQQLEQFLTHGYVPLPHQVQFHAVARTADQPDGPVMIGTGGKRGPGKTHGGFCQIALDDCQRVPNVKFLFLRKVQKAAKESFDDLRRKILRTVPHTYHKQSSILEFPNGSRIILGHFNHEDDVDQYLGIEYDGALIEEANTLSAQKIEMVRGSIRTSKKNWRPRVYLTFNPGGIGHQNMRKTFILSWREKKETTTRFVLGGHNPHLNKEYQAWLNGLQGVLGKMWRDGDWDVAGGAFFTNWSYDTHVRDLPIHEKYRRLENTDLIAYQRYWLSMDYGFNHYTVIHLMAADGDGNVYTIDEHCQRQWLIPQHNDALTAMLERHAIQRHQINTFVAGHDVFAKRHDGGSIADQWASLGWRLQPATIDRVNGAATMLQRLGNDKQPPTWFVSRRCHRLIETIPMLLSDPKRPEDVLKVDCDENGDGGDDAYDTARYGLMVCGYGEAGL